MDTASLTEEVGDLIQLFDVEDKNYGLFEIEAIDTATTTEYVSFDCQVAARHR